MNETRSGEHVSAQIGKMGIIDKLTMNNFSLHIQITWLGNKNRIRLSGVDGGHLVDNNANRPNGGYGWIDMAQGDSVILRAYASDYYLVQYRT